MADENVAVAAPPEGVTKPDARTDDRGRPKRQPRYHVVLWNDNDHSFDYVILMMKELFQHSIEEGFQIAKRVHTSGRAIVLTTTREHAELKRDQIHAYGKDVMIARCKGSMSSSVEPEC